MTTLRQRVVEDMVDLSSTFGSQKLIHAMSQTADRTINRAEDAGLHGAGMGSSLPASEMPHRNRHRAARLAV
jgi:hypothetical protein